MTQNDGQTAFKYLTSKADSCYILFHSVCNTEGLVIFSTHGVYSAGTALAGYTSHYVALRPTSEHLFRQNRLVEFKTAGDARAAIDTLQDVDLMGRPIHLREDREAPQAMSAPPRRGSGGSSGGMGTSNCKARNFDYSVDTPARCVRDTGARVFSG